MFKHKKIKNLNKLSIMNQSKPLKFNNNKIKNLKIQASQFKMKILRKILEIRNHKKEDLRPLIN
jgi:hypothetical protein